MVLFSLSPQKNHTQSYSLVSGLSQAFFRSTRYTLLNHLLSTLQLLQVVPFHQLNTKQMPKVTTAVRLSKDLDPRELGSVKHDSSSATGLDNPQQNEHSQKQQGHETKLSDIRDPHHQLRAGDHESQLDQR